MKKPAGKTKDADSTALSFDGKSVKGSHKTPLSKPKTAKKK